MFPSIKQFGLQVKLLGMLPTILWSSSYQQIIHSNSLHRFVLNFGSQIQTCQSISHLLCWKYQTVGCFTHKFILESKMFGLRSNQSQESMMFGSNKLERGIIFVTVKHQISPSKTVRKCLGVLTETAPTYTANIQSGKWDTRKKCKSYKYLPYILQCRSVDITVNHCKSAFTFFHCNWSSGTM